jgi:hypothetical protein
MLGPEPGLRPSRANTGQRDGPFERDGEGQRGADDLAAALAVRGIQRENRARDNRVAATP